jgi:hypothetical protein
LFGALLAGIARINIQYAIRNNQCSSGHSNE